MKMHKTPALIVIVLLSCNFDEGGKTAGSDSQNSDSIATEVQLSTVDKNRINNLIASVSPPIEMTYIISDLDLKFSSTAICPTDRISMFNSSTEKALALGIYGADMAYCLTYNRNDLSTSYLKAIKQLAVDLNIDGVIDFEKLESLDNKGKSMEDLASEFTIQMEKLSNHLQESDQLNISTMMSFGGWIESIYIATFVGKEIDHYSEELVDLIYYESLVSQNFLEIFKKFGNISGFESTYTKLGALMSRYEGFEVKREKIEPKVEHRQDMTQVVDLSKQTLKYDETKFNDLIAELQSIRNGVIKK